MLQLKNHSPFKALIAVFPDENGIDTLYTTIKATFKISGKIDLAEEQLPVVMADDYWGEPGKSSLKYGSEMHLTKPNTDIVMIGEACAPDKRPVTQVDVTLSVAGVRKSVRVFGDRIWNSGFLGLKMTTPLPFKSMPLVYERAFGGFHEIDHEKNKTLYEARNPIGTGFKGKRDNKEFKDSKLPNLEDPDHLIKKPEDKPAPACFGYVSSSWMPRVSYAGTYDESWMKKRAPYLPDDFDPRFFNAASPGLIYNGYIRGGEPVTIKGMSPDGDIKFHLPVCELESSVRIAGKLNNPPANIETVLFEPNQSRFYIIWRSAIRCDKSALKVEQIDINLKNLKLSEGAA